MRIRMNAVPAVSRRTIDQVRMNVAPALSKRSVLTGTGQAHKPTRAIEPPRTETKRVQGPTAGETTKQPVRQVQPESVVNSAPARKAPTRVPMPTMTQMLNKGQRCMIGAENAGRRIIVQCGWNVPDDRYDVDISVFLLNASGKVKNERGFIFYGSPESEDRAVVLSSDGAVQTVSIDFARMGSDIMKLVFVLTINESLEKNLNFSELNDVYIQLKDAANGAEICSYRVEEYYRDVTSMTLGEIYRHGGNWKFNPVGNGIRSDLAGQCAVYGIETC